MFLRGENPHEHKGTAQPLHTIDPCRNGEPCKYGNKPQKRHQKACLSDILDTKSGQRFSDRVRVHQFKLEPDHENDRKDIIENKRHLCLRRLLVQNDDQHEKHQQNSHNIHSFQKKQHFRSPSRADLLILYPLKSLFPYIVSHIVLIKLCSVL